VVLDLFVFLFQMIIWLLNSLKDCGPAPCLKSLRTPDMDSALVGTKNGILVHLLPVFYYYKPLDRIIINMSLVNFLLCCYKTVPAFLFFIRANILDQLGCRILLYSYHTLRLISIWSVENLSFLHLIKIRRPNHRWSKFIYRHQGQYVNGTLAGCWIVSILLQIPYLQYEKTTHRDNATIIWLSTSTCLGSTESLAMKFTTYFSISLDLALVVLVIVLNCFIIDLLYKHSRKVEATTSVTSNGWNKHTAQATKVLLSLLCIYVVCWISNDLVWIAIMSGYIKSDFENSILNELFGILAAPYLLFCSFSWFPPFC
uniref:Vomeronasal type-1 receptor n=1 Tax=Anolis carolinensis TaxID=28377 RepID=H9GQ48_ANOCA